MERNKITFDRGANRSILRTGFRVVSAESDEPVNTIADAQEEIKEPAIEEPAIEEKPVTVDVPEEIIATPEEPIIKEEEIAKPKISFATFLRTLKKEHVEEPVAESVAEEPVVEPATPEIAPVAVDTKQSIIDALNAKIDILTSAIAEKDEYIAKLKDYAQVSDEELRLAKEKNKTLVEITGKFIMKI